jgi:acyl carrier protein
MTASKDEIYSKLCELLEPFNTNKINLTETTEISADLNIDSVAVMDFIMEVEDAFDIDIPLNVLSETHTMADLVKVVESRIA